MEEERGVSAGTAAAYRGDLQRYLLCLEQQGLSGPEQAARDNVQQCLRQLSAAGMSQATIARNGTSIRRFHAFLLREGVCRIDPTENLDPIIIKRQAPDVLTVEEADRLLAAASGDEPLQLRDRAILELLYASGLRVSELTSLAEPSLLLETKLVRIHGRGVRERLVPMGSSAVSCLRRYGALGRPKLVRPESGEIYFLNARGLPLSRMTIWKTIRAAARKAGIDRSVNPNMLRHTFAAHLLAGGAALQIVQQFLGHADVSTTQIYALNDERGLKEVHHTYHPRR
jgi:integrase/recombinase XerD